MPKFDGTCGHSRHQYAPTAAVLRPFAVLLCCLCLCCSAAEPIPWLQLSECSVFHRQNADQRCNVQLDPLNLHGLSNLLLLCNRLSCGKYVPHLCTYHIRWRTAAHRSRPEPQCCHSLATEPIGSCMYVRSPYSICRLRVYKYRVSCCQQRINTSDQ